MIIVTLTSDEQKECINIANQRDANSLLKGRKDRYGYDSFSPEIKIKNSREGSMAEKAVSKLLNQKWHNSFIYNPSSPDVGEDIQVRSTHYLTGHLIIRPFDKLNHYNDKFILVIRDNLPHFKVIGYIFTSKAVKLNQYFGTFYPDDKRPPTWKIPQNELIPIENLII